MKDIIDFIKMAVSVMTKYFGVNLLSSFIVGIANAVFMCMTHMPHVILISIIEAVFNMIPQIGPIIGMALGSGILAITDVKMAIIFAIFSMVLQGIDGYILKPKLFGNAFGIPTLLSIAVVLIGGALFGPAGLFLAVPVTVIVIKWFEKGED